MKAVSTGPKRQRGYLTLISAGAAVTVFGILMAIQASQYVSKSRNDAAESAGVLAGQYKNALRAAVAREGTGLATGTYTGTGWLKRAGACSGASGSQAYLPCEFPNHLPLGLAYRTTVTASGGTVRAQVFLGAPETGGETYPYLAGSIVTAINGASNDHVTPVTQTYHVAEHDSTGNITLTVSNGPENNEYLKRDGSVEVTGDFDWGNFSISNVGSIQARAMNVSEGFWSGGDSHVSGMLSASIGVASPRFETISGSHHVTPGGTSRLNAANMDGNLAVGGNLAVEGRVTANWLRLGRTETEDGYCSSRSVGVNSSGELMSCVSGTWKKPGQLKYVETSNVVIFSRASVSSGYRYISPHDVDLSGDVPEGAKAIQLHARCGMRSNSTHFNMEVSSSGRRKLLLTVNASGGGDNIIATNSQIRKLGSDRKIVFHFSGDGCDGVGGLVVWLMGYFI